MPAKKPTYAQLARQVEELQSQANYTLREALRDLHKTSTSHLMHSAVVVRLTGLGGRAIVPQFSIADGFSPETVAAIKADIERAMQLSGFFDPYNPNPKK